MRTRDDQCCCQGRLGLGLGKAASRVQGALWLVQLGHVTLVMASYWSAQPPLSSWRPRLALEVVITSSADQASLASSSGSQWLQCPVSLEDPRHQRHQAAQQVSGDHSDDMGGIIMSPASNIEWDMRGIGIWSDRLTYELITDNSSPLLLVTSSLRNWNIIITRFESSKMLNMSRLLNWIRAIICLTKLN